MNRWYDFPRGRLRPVAARVFHLEHLVPAKLAPSLSTRSPRRSCWAWPRLERFGWHPRCWSESESKHLQLSLSLFWMNTLHKESKLGLDTLWWFPACQSKSLCRGQTLQFSPPKRQRWNVFLIFSSTCWHICLTWQLFFWKHTLKSLHDTVTDKKGCGDEATAEYCTVEFVNNTEKVKVTTRTTKWNQSVTSCNRILSCPRCMLL